MKAIYIYNKQNQFVGSDVVEDDYELTDGQTIVEPEEGLYQPSIFDGTKWVSADKEIYEIGLEKERQAYLKEHPELAKPSDIQMMLMNQATQITGMQKLIMSQASELAEMKKGSAE